jgi:hypothetical protein
MWRTFIKNISLNTLKDIYNTFSSEKSFLSSKKIERSLFVTSILAMYWTFFILVVLKATITDFILFISPLFIAAGFNLLQSEKNKKNDNPPNENL